LHSSTKKTNQPFNTWWAEKNLVLHTEFRDGNVPAGFEQNRVLEEAIGCLPEGVKTVRMRSETAGYQHELLKCCDREDNKWCGRIEFTVSSDVTPEFKSGGRMEKFVLTRNCLQLLPLRWWIREFPMVLTKSSTKW
jgi:hypothetical protein